MSDSTCSCSSTKPFVPSYIAPSQKITEQEYQEYKEKQRIAQTKELQEAEIRRHERLLQQEIELVNQMNNPALQKVLDLYG